MIPSTMLTIGADKLPFPDGGELLYASDFSGIDVPQLMIKKRLMLLKS